MTRVQFVPIPQPLVDEGDFDLETDFQPKHTRFCFSPAGELYVLSELFYNYYRYDHFDNRDFCAYLVTKYDRDLQLVTQAAFVKFRKELAGSEELRSDV